MPDFLNTTHRTVSWLKQVHDSGDLQMRPPFQRNPVWTDTQKAYLIDTILHGYPVPELYMQQQVDENGKETHIVVDGQQRITACLEFLEGKFSLREKDSPQWADMSFDDLSPDQKKQVYGYEFVVRKLPLVEDATLRDIFQRLNRNVLVLNPQELRHATYWGPFIKLMESIADWDYWEGCGLFTPNDVRRMLDIEFISELAIAVLHGPQNKKSSLEKWYAVYESNFEEGQNLEDVFRRTTGELSSVLPDLKRTRWRKKSDYYTLFLVFAKHARVFPLPRENRQDLRQKLITFSSLVDRCLAAKSPEELKTFEKSIVEYSKAVERAASDLANRKQREKSLEAALKGVWPDEAPEQPMLGFSKNLVEQREDED